MRICFLLFAMLALSAHAQSLSPEEADQFLDQLAQERKRITGVEKNFREEKITAINAKPVMISGTISFRAPDNFRREINTPSQSISISNGKKLWLYYPGLNEAEEYSLTKAGVVRDGIIALVASLNFNDVKKNFAYTITPNGSGWEVVLKPRSRMMRQLFSEIRIQLDSERRVTRMEITGEGESRQISTFWNERIRTFPEDYFDFKPPTGVQVSRPLGN